MIRRSARQSRLFRRISVLLVLMLCVVFVLPIPIAEFSSQAKPAGGSGKDTTVPFPCMQKSCGCRTAEDCWRGCCCSTNAQKLAWAKKHNVTVPQHVTEAAQKERQRENSPSDGGTLFTLLATLFSSVAPAQNSACCTKSAAPATATAAAACCSTPTAAQPRELSLRLVSTIRALQCRGLSLTLAVMSTMMVSTGPQLELQGEFPEFPVVVTSETLPDAPACPPVPPPRLRGV